MQEKMGLLLCENQAKINLALANFKAALSNIEKVGIVDAMASKGQVHRTSVNVMNNIVRIYIEKSELDQARDILDKQSKSS